MRPSVHDVPFAVTLQVANCDSRQESSDGEDEASTACERRRLMGHADDRMLELLYVLSGEGVCSSTYTHGGGERRVKAGDSVLAWAGTTRLTCRPQPDDGDEQQEGSSSLAVITFHLPLSLVSHARGDDGQVRSETLFARHREVRDRVERHLASAYDMVDGLGEALSEEDLRQILNGIMLRGREAGMSTAKRMWNQFHIPEHDIFPSAQANASSGRRSSLTSSDSSSRYRPSVLCMLLWTRIVATS